MNTCFARYGATIGLVAIGAMMATASGAAAAPTDNMQGVQTVVRKSVLISADPSGSVLSKSMVTQLSSVGNGTQTVKVPVGTDNLRNLNGFGAPAAQGNNAVFNLNVNGADDQRIYTSADIAPVTVKTVTTLDGKPIDPAKIINATGVLDVKYTITNTTTNTQTITYKNAAGNDVSKDVVMADPFVGSLSITLPQGFNEISAPGAVGGGDGNNGNLFNYSMVLFEPLGKAVVTVGYQSRITNATLPAISLTILPIIPFDNSTISATKDAFAGGAASATKIYDAGNQLGDGLNQLAAGVGQAIAGINKLYEGSNKLSTGLNAGLPGIRTLGAGINTLNNGASELYQGLLTLQSTITGIPQSADYQKMIAGLTSLITNFTAATSPSSPTGLPAAITGLGQINFVTDPANGFCTVAPACGPANAGGVQIATGLSTLNSGLLAAVTGLTDIKAGISGLVNTLAASFTSGKGADLVAGGQQISDGLDTANAGVNGSGGLVDSVTAAADGSAQLTDGLGKLQEAAPKLAAGVSELKTKGADGLVTAGETAQATFAPQVAQLNAAQAAGEAGAGIPYGKAIGAQTTTGVYQIHLAAAAKPTQLNIERYLLAFISLALAVGVGTVLWHRRAAA